MRTPFFYLSFLACLLFFSSTASAQDVKAMSLDDCIRYALQHSDTIKNVRLNVALQKATNAQITAGALPDISGKGEFDDYLNPAKTFLPGEFFNQPPGTFVPITFTPNFGASAAISGNQVLFDGPLLVALRARNSIIELVKQVGQLTEENIRYNIQRTYYAIVVSQRQFHILNEGLANARDIANEISILYKNGFVEKIDVSRSQVQLSNLETDSIRIGSLITTSEQLLKYQIGMDINEPIMLTDTAIEENLLRASSLAEDDLDYTKRTEYNLLQTELKLNQYQLKSYQLSALPKLSAFGNVGYNYSSNEFNEITQFRKNYLFSSLVGLQLTVPIFKGFYRTNQLKESKIKIEKTENNIHFLKLSLDFQLAQAQTALKNALLSIEKQQRNMELSNSVLDLSRKKYKAGVGSNLEVNQAQSDLLLSQNNYFQSLLDVINAQADMQRALGQFK